MGTSDVPRVTRLIWQVGLPLAIVGGVATFAWAIPREFRAGETLMRARST